MRDDSNWMFFASLLLWAAIVISPVLGYGIVKIIFQHAFGVHLWNPFG